MYTNLQSLQYSPLWFHQIYKRVISLSKLPPAGFALFLSKVVHYVSPFAKAAATHEQSRATEFYVEKKGRRPYRIYSTEPSKGSLRPPCCWWDPSWFRGRKLEAPLWLRWIWEFKVRYAWHRYSKRLVLTPRVQKQWKERAAWHAQKQQDNERGEEMGHKAQVVSQTSVYEKTKNGAQTSIPDRVIKIATIYARRVEANDLQVFKLQAPWQAGTERSLWKFHAGADDPSNSMEVYGGPRKRQCL